MQIAKDTKHELSHIIDISNAATQKRLAVVEKLAVDSSKSSLIAKQNYFSLHTRVKRLEKMVESSQQSLSKSRKRRAVSRLVAKANEKRMNEKIAALQKQVDLLTALSHSPLH